jgi:hypothetical protein
VFTAEQLLLRGVCAGGERNTVVLDDYEVVIR